MSVPAALSKRFSRNERGGPLPPDFHPSVRPEADGSSLAIGASRLCLLLALALAVLVVAVGQSGPAKAAGDWSGGFYGREASAEDACKTYESIYGKFVGLRAYGSGYNCGFRPSNIQYRGYVYLNCRSGQSNDGTACFDRNPKRLGCCEDSTGNPISPSSGNKFEMAVDFATGGSDSLAFVRSYNSHETRKTAFVRKWGHNFEARLDIVSANTIRVERPEGKILKFTKSGATWRPDSDVVLTLTASGSDWVVTDADDNSETYDSAGRLISIATRRGYTQTLAYDAGGQLQTVTDSYGRQLTFGYNAAGRLVTMTTPNGEIYRYTYDNTFVTRELEPNRLHQVIFPDDTLLDVTDNPRVTYLYERSDGPYLLTGILDEKGERFATFDYDSERRATLSKHAGDTQSFSIAYNADGTRSVTNPLGKVATYSYTTIAGAPKLSGVAEAATANTPASNSTTTYDANGFVASRTDKEGKVTNYVHDSRGLETSRTEAFGTPEARTITTTWLATLRLPDVVTGPGRTTDLDYDAQGRLTSVTVTDTTSHSVPYSTNGQTRTWAYTYSPTGQVLTVDGPRTDVTDVTTFEYDAQGNRNKIIDALGHTTRITAFDGRGLPLTVIDRNGVETGLSYDPRGWLRERRVKQASGDAVTTFDYDAAGQLLTLTQPDGTRLHYEYDAAQRLEAVRNDLGERIEYTLDAMGNRTAETVKSATGTIKRSQTRVFDELGRLLRSIGASGQTWTYAYDKNDNLETVTDPAAVPGVTQRAFDALDRLIQVTDPALGVADYGYDARDNLTSVTDQRRLTTSYVHNAFGDVIQVDSPDSGVTVYLVDPAGNVTQMTDARGVVADFTHDALNRVLTRSYPADAAQNVTYGYDDTAGGNHGVGRLTSMTDQSGSAAYRYDHRGNLVEEARTIGTTTFTTGYAYDLADNVVTVTYPSGRIVNYDRDDLGRVAGVTTQENAAAVPVTIAADIAYLPFGPMESFTFGNGVAVTYAYDQDYRLTDIDTGGAAAVQDLTIGYDGRDNITAITDNLDATRTQGFGYDALSRLTGANGPYGSIAYSYDAVGNRETRDVTVGAVTTSEAYTYALDSNRLLTVDLGGTLRSLTHGASGNITADDRGADPDLVFDYDLSDRLVQVNRGGLPLKQYLHNAIGERVVKQAPGGFDPEYFHYDQAGRLLAESDGTGAWPRSYVYLNGLTIAQVEPGSGAGTPIDVILDNGTAGTMPSGTWTASTAGQGFEGADHQVRPAPLEVPEGGQTIDNASADFATVGVWTSSTGSIGYEGADYLTRNATSSPVGSETIVDNSDTAFSAHGHWGVATASGAYGADSLVHFPGLLPLATEIVDNADPGFSVTGGWTTNVPSNGGHYGTDQALIDAGAPSPASVIIDNKDPAFLSIGLWQARANGSGFEGSNFQRHEDNLAPVGWVMDNNDNTTAAVGDWVFSTDGSGYWGNNFQRNDSGSGAETFTWTPRSFDSGTYKIYARWRAHSLRATDAPYTIHHAGGSTTVRVNQKAGGARWNLLGIFALEPGQNHRVILSDDANGRVVADSLYFIPSHEVADNLDPNTSATGVWSDSTGASGYFGPNFQTNDAGTGAEVFTWTLDVPQAGQYEVFARWTAHSNRASDAPYTIHHASGSTTVTIDQKTGGGVFTHLGTFQLAPGANHRVELSDNANGRVAADAVAMLPVGAQPNRAYWAPEVAQSRGFEVYAKWRAYTDYATDATYTVHHAGGSTQKSFNQRQNGGTWMPLGTFTFDPGGGHRVEITDQANGVVVADAVRLDPTDAPNAAVWTPTVATAGDYRVYAWWRADSNRASNAPYTIHHAGGSTTVVVDQSTGGSRWNLLGTFALAPGGGHRVELTDLGVNGRIVADAVAFAPVDAEPNQADWDLAAPIRDRYEVYARWVAHGTRASDATYRVAHEGGETSVVVNQKASGSKWNLLGIFDLAAGAGEVRLSGDANGRVSADAVRMVGQPRTTPRLATWRFQVPSAEAYEIYAKWPEAPGHASNASYTIHHAGGTSTATRSQRQGGGRWNLLGTYSFAPGTGYRVELTDQGDGGVVADAIYVVKAARSYDSYSWAPALPSAGDYAVYAKWAADAGRAA